MSALMLVLALILAVIHVDFTDAEIGVAFGINGDNLLPPSQVVKLYKHYGIQRMRIYEPCEATLEALQGTNIELTMSVLNDQLPHIAASQTNANQWVKKYISDYTPGVIFKNIVVGNEISPSSENHQFVLPAMQNVNNALSSAGLQAEIKVTTSIGMEIVVGYPPEEGKFKDDALAYITPIINLVVKNDAPLLANFFPYFAKLGKEGEHIDLDYALLDPSYSGVKTKYNHTYQNLYSAMHDTVFAAVGNVVASCPELSDADGYKKHVLHGGESGWSKKRSKGHHKIMGAYDDNDDVANVENAKRYVNNLIQVVKRGTPLQPGRPIPTFIFAMFDENLKPGDEEERNFGIFLPNGTASYTVNFN